MTNSSKETKQTIAQYLHQSINQTLKSHWEMDTVLLSISPTVQ